MKSNHEPSRKCSTSKPLVSEMVSAIRVSFGRPLRNFVIRGHIAAPAHDGICSLVALAREGGLLGTLMNMTIFSDTVMIVMITFNSYYCYEEDYCCRYTNYGTIRISE